MLRRAGVSCLHSGLYDDPITNKAREFDIRATARPELGACHIWLAIECKNVRPNFPMLLSCVPRHRDEAFHDLIVGPAAQKGMPFGNWTVDRLRITGKRYCHQDAVSKNLAQIGRARDGEIVASDADVFEKWTQALASSVDLVNAAHRQAAAHRGPHIFVSVLPILVIPDGSLWGVEYNRDGSRSSVPKKIDKCSYYVGKDVPIEGSDPFRVSHIEIMTFSALEQFASKGLQTIAGVEDIFPSVDIASWVHQQ